MLIKRPNSAVLCLQCTNLLPLLVEISKPHKNGDAYTKWWGETYGKIRNIRGLVPDKCELCRILQNEFGKLSGFSSTDTTIDINYVKFATYKDLQHGSCLFNACGARLSLAPVLPVVQTDDGEDIKAFTGRFVLPLMNPLLVRDWLDRCERHIGCGADHSSKDFNFTFRLIDVQKGCLIEAPVDCRYVALSYVWGNVKQVMLNKATQKFLEQEGSISSKGLKDPEGEYINLKPDLEGRVIPRTIRDAILFCILVKENYLWTDSLCILQDDEFQDANGAWTNADKVAQIPKMDIIYGASLLTVIGASGADSNAGLPGVHFSNTRTAQVRGKIGDQIFVSVDAADPLSSLWSSKWSERGWTFQEFLLSKRHLIFLPEQAVFHCSTCSWSEDYSLEFVESPDSMSVPAWTVSYKLKQLLLPDTSRWSQEVFFPAIFINQFYTEWLKNFLRRRLTAPSDILSAFNGALSASTRYLGNFHYGLPVDYFCECLHWVVGRSSMYTGNGSPDEGLTKRRQGFPSWSWTGWIWDVASYQEFHTNYKGKSPAYWCRVGVYGTKVVEDGSVELWKISSPDIEGWNRLEYFSPATFQTDDDFIQGELKFRREIIMKSPIPIHCLVIKTATAEIFISDQQLGTWTSEVSVFTSSDLTSENRIGEVQFPNAWRSKRNKSLQVIITGSYFHGPSPKWPDKTDESDPMIDCLVVEQVSDGEMERLTTFATRFSHARKLEWKPIVTVLR